MTEGPTLQTFAGPSALVVVVQGSTSTSFYVRAERCLSLLEPLAPMLAPGVSLHVYASDARGCASDLAWSFTRASFSAEARPDRPRGNPAQAVLAYYGSSP
jgi:hypothetical protein